MPQTRLKSRPSSLPHGNLERAIRAAHEEFERALVSEWDAGSDSAHIRNAMTPVQYRCRHCKKPATGLGNLCDCRAKKDWERCVLNPNHALHGLLQQRCREIVDSSSLERFVQNLVGISAANDFDLNWIECKIRSLLPSLKDVCRKWVIDICPPPFAQTGVLPAWFKDDGEVIPDSDLQLGLDTKETEAELGAIEAKIEQCFEEATKSALDKASLRLAQVVYNGPKRSPRRRARQDPIASIVAIFKRDNPGSSIEQICKILDMERGPLRGIERRAGFSTWHGAWEDLDHRPRIKRFISGTLPAAPKKKI
jgi:hypothetical protein